MKTKQVWIETHETKSWEDLTKSVVLSFDPQTETELTEPCSHTSFDSHIKLAGERILLMIARILSAEFQAEVRKIVEFETKKFRHDNV